MKNYPHFEINNPSTKEEKLIMELIQSLYEVTHVFIKLNNPGILTNEIFNVLRDAAIGYAGKMIIDLIELLVVKDQKIYFLEQAKCIFNCYIEEIKKDLK